MIFFAVTTSASIRFPFVSDKLSPLKGVIRPTTEVKKLVLYRAEQIYARKSVLASRFTLDCTRRSKWI